MNFLDTLFLTEFFPKHLVMSISAIIPEIILVALLVVSIVADVVFDKCIKNNPLQKQKATGYVTLFGFVVTLVVLICGGIVPMQLTFMGTLAIDPFSQFFKVVILVGAIITTLMTFNSKELLEGKNGMGEYFILLIGMTLGMFLLSSASNLIMIYIAFELMSISSYVLAGYTKEVSRASEASLKYVIYGSLASGVMIYGMSLLFGATGTLSLIGMQHTLAQFSGNFLPVIIGGIMVFAGIAYKISAVPFHFWTPDVYEGSPVATSALLSVASKAAGFAVLFRVIKLGFIDTYSSPNAEVWNTISAFDWKYLIGIIAVLTMTLGNLIALWQENVKRMLAYSSIAHCGYMLLGVMVMDTPGVEGVMFYFVTYLLMNFGAFFAVQLIANKFGSEDMNDYAGMAYKNPYIALALSVFLVSLTGMPPFAGFLSKYYLFMPVIKAGYVGFAVVGVLNSVVSVFYYMKVVRNMYLRGNVETDERLSFGKPSMLFLYLMAVPVALMLIYFQPVLEWIKYSAKLL